MRGSTAAEGRACLAPGAVLSFDLAGDAKRDYIAVGEQLRLLQGRADDCQIMSMRVAVVAPIAEIGWLLGCARRGSDAPVGCGGRLERR
jgi:hypothetical protein